MSKIWRWIAPVAAAGTVVAGVLASTGIPAQAATQASYHVTIGARGTAFGSVKGKVAGRALVAYKAAGHDRGTVSGTVTGNLAGDVVSLRARPFRATTFKATGQQVTLTAAGTGSYSFSVQPSLATSYQVQVSTTAGATTTVDATSGPVDGLRRGQRARLQATPEVHLDHLPVLVYREHDPARLGVPDRVPQACLHVPGPVVLGQAPGQVVLPGPGPPRPRRSSASAAASTS